MTVIHKPASCSQHKMMMLWQGVFDSGTQINVSHRTWENMQNNKPSGVRHMVSHNLLTLWLCEQCLGLQDAEKPKVDVHRLATCGFANVWSMSTCLNEPGLENATILICWFHKEFQC